MKTADLISELAGGLRPVRPLRAPLLRALGWSLAALFATLAALFLLRGLSLHPRSGSALIIFETLALACVVLLSAGALCLSIPGREARVYVAAAAICLSAWVAFALQRAALYLTGAGVPPVLSVALDAPCARDIVLAAVPAAAVLFSMMRSGLTGQRVLAGAGVGWSAGVAAVIMLRAFCPNDEALHGLVAHVGPVLLLGALAAPVGRLVLAPRKMRPRLLD